MMNILQAMQDDALFAKVFKRNWRGADTWKAWRSFLAALFGLPLDADARAIYEKHTGRSDTPATAFQEGFVIAGRRSGKSLVAAAIAVFLACFKDYSDVLAPGETGVVPVIAADRRQARVILGYVNGFFDTVPMLARLVRARLKEGVELTSGVRIEVHTSSFRAVRGYTILGGLCDELAFWPTEDSANPDVETLNALRPGMATVPGALLLCISSPYARRGALWEAYREHYGKNEAPVLVWKAPTTAMNPTVSRAVIAAAYLKDTAAAAAEYGGEFRSDVEDFIPLEVIEARVMAGRFELPPLADTTYTGFVDPSGGQQDSMTLAIAHVEKGTAVLDCLREVPAPFSPEQAVAEFSETLKTYRVSTVMGDRYGGEWPREQFEKRGIEYRTSEKTRSELYLELLPALMSGRVELLDNRRLVTQLVGLERRTARAGRDSIDHGPGAHDDVANAAAGALVETLRTPGGELGLIEYLKGLSDGTIPDPTRPATALECVRASQEKVSEAATICPACGSNLLRKLSSGMEKRCQQCGKQFGLPLKPAALMSRAEWLRPPGRG